MVSRETQLALYFRLLERWNRVINLSARDEFGRDWFTRQVETSLALGAHIPLGVGKFTDLGSGQGFPAIPLAIATGMAIDLVEADHRKAAFLNTALAKLRLPGKVWPTRIELAQVPPASCVTAQALAALPRLIPLALPMMRRGGCGLFLKGESVAAELEVLPHTDVYMIEVISLTPLTSSLVKVTRLN